MQAYYTVHCKMEDNACKLTIRYIVKWRITHARLLYGTL